jgi:hypothetical protein
MHLGLERMISWHNSSMARWDFQGPHLGSQRALSEACKGMRLPAFNKEGQLKFSIENASNILIVRIDYGLHVLSLHWP